MDMFVSAVKEVFQEIGFQDLEVSGPVSDSPPSEIIATIGLTGDLHGYIILRTTKPCALAFITKMLDNLGMEGESNTFGQFHKEALGEILNQISGRSTMLLSNGDINCDITPPTIMIGDDLFVNITGSDHYGTYVLKGKFGYFSVFISYKKMKD